jgi:hypothetical protein
MNLNNKKFVTAENKNGLSSDETIFYYSENKEGIITATYKGGAVIKGFILGKRIDKSNTIELIYHCITKDGELKAGESKGIITTNKDKKLILKFNWNWLNGDITSGTSTYIEID